MSSRSTPHRRPRSEIEDDDSDMARRSHDSTPSNDSAKRVRTNGYQSEQQSSSSRQRSSNIYDDNDEDDIEGASDTDEGTNNEFQPGAIVRVKLTNFITYENAEFFPGPNLNMVIGPNGTGKSSLVCAICLGLGWNPSHLGRAGQIGEFVKHNKNDAYVEIELQRRPTEARNHVVRLRIIKDGNLREWWLDGRKTSHKNIQKVTTDFNIQVDNLCQFLPQDKVSEFAALSPEDLLLQTQRAAAPEEMLQQHEQLKQLRKLQKTLDIQLEQDKESLGAMENRQENLRAEVQRLQERREIQERISLLQKTVPFAEYKIARMRHMEYKKKKEDAQARFRDLEENLGPTIASIKHKEDYRDQIEVVVKERKAVVDSAEREAASCIKDIEGLDENIQKNEKAIEFERVGEGKRRKEVAKIQRTITNLKAKANEEPIEFDAGTWNERIRAKDKLLREIDAELRELKAEDREISIKGREVKDNISNAEIELAALDTHEGQQLNRLEKVSRETAKAWKWVQDNADKFDKEVYGPPLISCSIKDARYIDAIESIFRQSDYLTITAQTTSDFKKLSDYLHGEMKFAEFPLRTSDSAGLDDPRPLSRQDLNRLGMDGWAIDFIDGPEAVLSMLCGSIQVHRTAISLRDITDDQYNGIVEAQQLNSFVAGSHSYKITRRKEYGPLAVSTSTRAVSPARYWVDQPVDTAAREEIQHKIVFLRAELEKLKTQITPIREKIKDLNSSASEAKAEAERLKEEKGTLQKARNEQLGIPTKIESEEKDLDVKSREKVEYLARIKTINTQQDHAVLLKAKLSLGYKSIVTKIRSYHEDLLDAEVRLIEAKSDVEGLKDRNRDIDQQIEDERRQVKEAEKESKKMKDAAQKALDMCQVIRSDPENAPHIEHFSRIPEGMTVEGLQNEISAEEAKLEFVHANNPNAIRDFEKRQADVDKLKEKIAEAEQKLEKISRSLAKIRGKWEPALDALISEISEAFSYNFEQIGCAGEVGIHKHDDFDLWAIQIRVKFRENETLQLLDAHRQSGGERSVSTIFYLMSLQALARAPFRVVDEINQGMDPRNERMVHERMVEIACKEHTSQYFLITPKLLTGLRYDKRMKVLCIASGEHMPANYKTLDVSKIVGIQRAIMASG